MRGRLAIHQAEGSSSTSDVGPSSLALRALILQSMSQPTCGCRGLLLKVTCPDSTRDIEMPSHRTPHGGARTTLGGRQGARPTRLFHALDDDCQAACCAGVISVLTLPCVKREVRDVGDRRAICSPAPRAAEKPARGGTLLKKSPGDDSR